MSTFSYKENLKSFEYVRRLIACQNNNPNLRFLELGTYEGETTEYLLSWTNSVGSKPHVSTVDINPQQLFQSILKKYDKQIDFINDTTFNALIHLYKNNCQFDFIYIDACHNASNVLEDAVLAFRLLKPGSLMLFDDYLLDNEDPAVYTEKLGVNSTIYQPPRVGIDAFMTTYKNQYITIYEGYQILIEKR